MGQLFDFSSYPLMGRHRGKLDYRNEAADVAVRFKSEKTVCKKERLQAIKLLLETSLSYAEVSKIIGKAPSRIKDNFASVGSTSFWLKGIVEVANRRSMMRFKRH